MTAPTIAPAEPTAADVADAKTFDFGSLTPSTVAMLQPGKRVEDIPATIVSWVEQSYKDGSNLSITLPTSLIAQVLQREARDYCHIRPAAKLVFRSKTTPDGLTVNFSARDIPQANAAQAAPKTK